MNTRPLLHARELRFPSSRTQALWLSVAIVSMMVSGCQKGTPVDAPAPPNALMTEANLGLASWTPTQGFVFDGSLATKDSYGFAFKDDAGFLLDLGEPGSPCPGAQHTNPGGTFTVFDGRGVFQPFASASSLVSAPLDPRQLPAGLAGLTTSCELLDVPLLLGDYLNAVETTADGLVAQLAGCVDQAHVLYCHLVASIENAPVAPPAGKIFATPSLSCPFNSLPPNGFASCPSAVDLLHRFPPYLDVLESLESQCLLAHERLNSIQNEVDIDAATLGLPENLAPELLAEADEALSYAESVLAYANEWRSLIDTLISNLTPESIGEFCDLCMIHSLNFTALKSSGAVRVTFGAEPLGRYIGALRSAADANPDPEQASRFDALAERLIRLDGARVMQVTFASGSSVGQEALALASSGAPDDGLSPQAIVLTALDETAPLPAPDAGDVQLLLDALRRFQALLHPGRR